MLNTDPIEGIIPLRNRKWRGIEDSDEVRSVLRSRFRESETFLKPVGILVQEKSNFTIQNPERGE